VAAGRDQFTFNRLLPPVMAAAVEMVQEDLPSDPLSACLTYLVGLTGLLKIGTRASSSLRHHVPINLFFALVAWSGVAKSPQKRKLVERPAAGIIKDAREYHDREMRHWRQQCKEIKRKEDRPPEPKCVLPHLTDYNAASLAAQLMEHDKKGQPILLIRDELAGLLKAIEHDTKSGTGQAEAQLLELFEGDGFTSVRVEAGLRWFSRSHVSLFGCIQPEVLRELINSDGDGDDSTGKWARFLFCRLPARPLALMDADPTQAEIDALMAAERMLQKYAEAAYRLPPKAYHLDKDARRYFHEWFRKHQQTALLPGTPPVIRSMLMKTSAHALRLAGALHIAQVLELGDAAPLKIGGREVETATAIVDQLHEETCLFHDRAETDELLLMRHVHALGDRVDGCTWQWAKKKGGRRIRAMRAEKFAGAVNQLVANDYGRVVCDQPLTYRALKPMTQ
jgi:CRISPR-associated protein Cmr3